MSSQIARGSSGENGKPGREQQILQDGEVALDHLAFDMAVPRHRRNVEQVRLRERGCLEETPEGRHVSGQPLLLDLLSQVGFHVAAQVGLGKLGIEPIVDARKMPELQ